MDAMVIPITVGRAQCGTRRRALTVTETRKRALERLYRRKLAVDELIRSLEIYREAQRAKRRLCLNGGSEWRR